MIATLRGTVTSIGDRYATVETGGLGYKVFMTADALHGLKTGSETRLFTHLSVREDAHELYGFPAAKDRDAFELLIGISGIGPRSAMNVLSLVSTEALAQSVRTGSVAHLVKVSGIGRKTAEKIVLELRDKMSGIQDGEAGGGAAAGMSSDMDAIEALRSLGYGADEAREALKKVSADPKTASLSDTGAKVKAALKQIGKA